MLASQPTPDASNGRSDDRVPLPIGFKVSGYRIESILGHGGFALTYKARDMSLQGEAAIKEFMPLGIAVRGSERTVSSRGQEKGAIFDWGLKSFLNEARTLGRFNHRNLIRIITAGRGNGTAYIIMEFVDGPSFSDAIVGQIGRPGQEELMKVIFPLIQGLKHVHAAGIIHRDIKPDNILIRREDSSPVLLDFGSARYAVGSKSRALTEIVSHGYSPFEQYQQASEQGPWTDIYALSAVVHHAITGKAPPPAPDRLNAQLNNTEDPLPLLSEVAKGDYSETFLRAIDYGLNILEKDRPQSLEQWEEAFDPKSGTSIRVKAQPRNLSLLQDRDPGRFRRRALQITGIAVGAALTLAMAGYFLKPVVFPPDVILHVQGSNTIGETLMPALAKAYLQTIGANDAKERRIGTETENQVEASVPGELTPLAIEIRAYGSGTSAKGLVEGKDIGMSSRRILPEEVKSLQPLGDMLSPDSEHVVGLDGVSVIVNKDNPIGKLTKDQIHDIFTGTVKAWNKVSPGYPGPIHLYARDNKSGTYDTFVFLVLGKDKLDGEAKRYESSERLSDDVAADPDGIGFIGLPYVRRSKALAVSDAGAPALFPTRLTVGLEEYPLSRRLYLYTPQNPKNPRTLEFIRFALSEQGQAIVERENFVTLNVSAELPPYDPNLPIDYVRATYGARRLSLNFRFVGESYRLDGRSVRDLVRVAHYAKDPNNKDRRITLIGFNDKLSNPKAESTASMDRANAVASELAKQDVHASDLIGMGARMQVASNETETGRARNRRVEIWMR